MKTISLSIITEIHKLLIDSTGGLDGLRDYNGLQMCLNSSFQTFDGIELYPTNIDKIARTGFNIISTHPFVDGNKRTGILVMLTLLELNDIYLNYSDDYLVKLGLGLASGKINYDDLVEWVKKHLQ